MKYSRANRAAAKGKPVRVGRLQMHTAYRPRWWGWMQAVRAFAMAYLPLGLIWYFLNSRVHVPPSSTARVIRYPAFCKRLVLSLAVGSSGAQAATEVGTSPHPHNLAFQRIYPPGDDIGQKLGGVHAISQDTHGFMWFGGEGGLARFDGNHSRWYSPEANSPGALNHGFVRRILHDSFREMWVATERGLCRYEEKTDRFDCDLVFSNGAKLPKSSTQALIDDQRNFLYVGTHSGVYSISPDRSELLKIHLPMAETGEPYSGLVVDLAVDHEGHLWIATENRGLFSYSPQTGYVKHYYFMESAELVNPLNIATNRLKCVTVDHLNRVWIGSVGGGFSILNSGRTGFTHYQTREFADQGLSSDVIWEIFEDSQRQVWLAIDQAGLVLFDEQSQHFHPYRHKPYDQNSIQSDQLRTLFEDRNGDIWLGLFPYGVNFHNRATQKIQNYTHEPGNLSSLSHSAVLSITGDQSNTLWVGTEDGLNQFDPLSGQFYRFQQKHEIGLTSKAVLSLHPREDGHLWVGTWSSGLLEFDPSLGRFTAFTPSPLSDGNKPGLFIWDILLNRRNDWLVATEYNGLNVISWPDGAVKHVKNSPETPDRLPHNFVWDVLQSGDGTLWLATQGGVIHLTEEYEEIERFALNDPHGLQSDRILAVFESSQNTLWLGTQDQGAALYDRANRRFHHLNINRGLPSNEVSGFIEDARERIWILTSNGLAMYDPVTGDLKTLKKEDGLVGNNFNRKAAYRNRDGVLFVGGTDGLSAFHPDDMFEPTPDFSVKFTSFRIFNSEVPVSADGPLQESVVTAQEIRLKSSHTMFTLDFAALNYRNLSSMEYLYRLEGFDKEWNTVRGLPSATYTNIQPGAYSFQVRVNRDGYWADAASLRIVVLPTIWQSGWAILAYFAVGLILLGFIVNYWRLHMRTAIYRDLSMQDSLTGLRNRAGLMQEIDTRYHVPSLRQDLCFIFMDVDHFKRINDHRGHQAGDQVLKDVARILCESVRQADIPSRWGGEEFLLMCANVKAEDARALAEKIRSNLAAHTFHDEKNPLKVTSSFGVAIVRPDETFNQTFRRVDKALYQAKAAGRNCVVMADD